MKYFKGKKSSMRIVSGMLALGTALCFASCGAEEGNPAYTVGGNTGASAGTEAQGSESADKAQSETVGEVTVKGAVEDELLYFAQELDLVEEDDSVHLYMRVHGEEIVYGGKGELIFHALKDGGRRVQSLQWAEQAGEWSVNQIAFGEDGSVYASVSVRADAAVTQYICKFDTQGQLVYATDLTQKLQEQELRWNSNWQLEADADGRLYVSVAKAVWLFEADGTYAGSVNLGDVATYTLVDLEAGADGTVYVGYQSKGASVTNYVAEIDFANKKVTGVQKTAEITGLSFDGESFLVWDAKNVYRYDRENLTFVPDFTWEECHVIEDDLQEFTVLPDGRMLAITYDYGLGGGVTFLEGLTEEQALAKGYRIGKTDILLATYGNELALTDLNNLVAEFNKQSEEYQVVTENYTQGILLDGETAYNRLNSELVAGKGPDIMMFGDFEEYAEKGAVENLYDYLEKSEVLSKEDFFENVLEQYTIDGVLVTIPWDFTLRTLVGSPNLVGEEMGWTIEEIMALSERYPDKQLIYGNFGMTKRSMLVSLIRFYGQEFMDWESGTCNFISPQFKQILQFVGKFPDEAAPWTENAPSAYSLLETGEALLAEINMNRFKDMQTYQEALGGELTFIGYPSPTGAGCFVQTSETLAINANSKCKEGAWAFLEFLLQHDDGGDEFNMNGFPTNKNVYQKLLESSMAPGIQSVTVASDGWRFQKHKTTQEEADQISALIENMQFTSSNSNVVNIIMEEAESYFSGQKPLDAVVEIIQNRVQNYMDEQ